MNTGRSNIGAAGIQTAALGFGGYIGPVTAATEKYDGTSWTTISSMSTARRYLGGAGTQAAALGFGGTPSGTATEEYNEFGPSTATITTT